MINYGDLVVFVTPKGKRYIKRLQENLEWHTNSGVITAQQIQAVNYGDIVFTSLGLPVRVLEATLEDKLMGLKRQTQIIYPKDIAYICLKLGIGPGKVICEAGCGSGGLTLAMSWYAGATGKIFSQDNREEFVILTRKNLDWAGLGTNVELACKNLEFGFNTTNADSVFLDVREPWLFIEQAEMALKSGGMLGFLLPTTNQASELLIAIENRPFCEIEMMEIIIRKWKTVPDRLRPFDRMTAHTSFLIFCRKGAVSSAFDEYKEHGTRERKQEAARIARSQLQTGSELPLSQDLD